MLMTHIVFTIAINVSGVGFNDRKGGGDGGERGRGVCDSV